jgi:hypothetical protein
VRRLLHIGCELCRVLKGGTIVKKMSVFVLFVFVLCSASLALCDDYEMIPAGFIDDKPFYIDYALFFQEYVPDFTDGKSFVKFDDKYGIEQEVIWIWFSGGVKEARLYAFEVTDNWDDVALGNELFRVALGPNDILDFHTQIPEGMPRTAIWFVTPHGERAYALGYNGRTGSVNPVQIKVR